MRAHARDPSSLISNLIHELSALVTHLWEIHVSRERKNSITCYLRPHPLRSSVVSPPPIFLIYPNHPAHLSHGVFVFSFFDLTSHMERAPRMLHVPRQPRALRGGSFLDLDHGCHATLETGSRGGPAMVLPDAPRTALASSRLIERDLPVSPGGFGCSAVCLCDDDYTRLNKDKPIAAARRSGSNARCGRRR